MCENKNQRQLIEDRNHKGKISKTNLRDMILENQDISNLDYSHITDMSYMFSNCDKLTTLPKMDVSKVENMEGMFEYCPNFNGDIGDWDVSNVTNMKHMFQWCRSFNQDLNKWNVENSKNMEGMFRRCSSFNKPLDKWKTSKVKSMKEMFSYCFVFNQDLSNWDVGEVEDMRGIFYSPKSTLANIYDIFKKASKRQSFTTKEILDLSGYKISKPEINHPEPFWFALKTWKLNKNADITNAFSEKEAFLKVFSRNSLLEHLNSKGLIDDFVYKTLKSNIEKNNISLKLLDLVEKSLIKPN